MQFAVIVNPISGRAGRRTDAARERQELAARVLREIHGAADVVVTTARGHGADLARAFVARSFDRVIAWGGDGTVNEVAGPLIGSNTALGIVPSGSGDGFAHGVGLPTQSAQALVAALRQPVTPIDVGWFGDRHFLNVCGVGFDAVVAHGFNALKTRGPVGYVKGGLSLVWAYRAESYAVQLGEKRFDGPRFLVAFSNGREYGNRLVLSAHANPSDGWLDAVVVDAGAPLQQLWRARRLAVGVHRPARGVHRMRVQHATIAGDRLVCHVDGETFETKGTVDVKIQPKGILIAGAVIST
jgi:YegS/Rv2252/BmrU family lipid kinase